MTCNPKSNLHSGQSINPNCFAAPTVVGVAGPTQYPYMRGPHYVDNDLSIFKSFPTRESQRIEFRVQGQNFINHPNPQFTLGGVNDLQLQFAPTLGSTNNNTNMTGAPKFTTGQRLMTFSAKYFF